MTGVLHQHAPAAADSIDLATLLRPGDHIVFGQACGLPTTLAGMLARDAERIPDLSAFIATSFSGDVSGDLAKSVRLSSMGAIGSLRALTEIGALSVIPLHVGQVAPMISAGIIACDVAMIQVSPADAQGNHSCGLIADFVRAAVRKARLVIAEINDDVPFTPGEMVHTSEIDLAIQATRPPIEVPALAVTETDLRIAGHCASFIGDGAVIQTGVGCVPDAIARLLCDRRNLGIHSGMIGDGLIDLVECGAVTNARKEIDRGISIAGALVGTRRLYDWAHCNPAIRLAPSSHTHDAGVLSRLSRLVTINSAMEVDLTGQVNAEQTGSSYIGGTGGQVDFVRAGSRSAGGHAIIALQSTARKGTVSRIVPSLGGPVTTARSDVDIIVTEHGVAELKGVPLAERTRRLVAIAHPDFREELDRQAFTIRQRGF